MRKKTEQCAFCDNVADSKEHVIPRWIQRYYNLKNQNISLWNGTTIKYSQALIPACKLCNSERFSRLENKIQNGTATMQDYYLWALKIRYGLAVRDSTLLIDRRNPKLGSVLPKEELKLDVDFIKHAFKALDNPDFYFQPSPLGSVFLFKQSTSMKGEFDLVDIPPPFWALSIVVPPDNILLVLFADRGAVRKCLSKYYQRDGGVKHLLDRMPEMTPRTLAFFILRWQNHLILPNIFRSGGNYITGKALPKRIKIRTQKIDWYYKIAKHCAFSTRIAEEAYLQDLEAFGSIKSIRCR